MKRVIKWIGKIVKKVVFEIKMQEMDFFASFMGMDSWMLFPPSYYYRFSSEELEKMKIEMREKVQEIFDAWECEEQEEKENIIKKMKM